MASSSIALASVAAKIDTIAQVRAAMGAVTVTLAEGYSKLDEITSIAGVKDAARSLLDTVNKSAGILYNIYNDDPDLQDEEISTYHAHIAGVIISEANDALTSVEKAADFSFWDIAAIVDQALATVGAAVGSTLQGITNAIAAGGSAFFTAAWPTLAIIGAALAVGLYLYHKAGNKLRSVL